eukprot:20358-Chlamydomonas_euryale.AAC.1
MHFGVAALGAWLARERARDRRTELPDKSSVPDLPPLLTRDRDPERDRDRDPGCDRDRDPE